MYDDDGSKAIMPNYNKDWSRYMSDPGDPNHLATNIYDKYNNISPCGNKYLKENFL